MTRSLILFKLATGSYSPSWPDKLPGVPFSGQTYLIGNHAYKVVQTTDFYGYPQSGSATGNLDYPGITEDRDAALKAIADATNGGEWPQRVHMVEVLKENWDPRERFPMEFI